jgi:predicted membrane-bound spermidine synthase
MKILKLIVFISGAILMSLEIVGSRVLSPYFGNSVFVWSSLISVFLMSLSFGYHLGGKLSDKMPEPKILSAIIFGSGVLIFIIPFIQEPVNNAIFDFDLGMKLSPLIASSILFLIPSILMGAVSPFAVRMSVKSIETVGNVSGNISAISTIGNIFGTLFTSFYLIPTIGTKLIINLLGLTLLLTSLLIWLCRQNILNKTRS